MLYCGNIHSVADSITQGGDNNLYVAMAKYIPTVRCDRSSTAGPPWLSCLHIWGDMKVGQERLVFGPKSDPSVQVQLPTKLRAGKYSR